MFLGTLNSVLGKKFPFSKIGLSLEPRVLNNVSLKTSFIKLKIITDTLYSAHSQVSFMKTITHKKTRINNLMKMLINYLVLDWKQVTLIIG